MEPIRKEEPQEELQPVVILERQFKVFMNSLNCQFGYILSETLLGDNQENEKKHIVCGTTQKNSIITAPGIIENIVDV